jgi:hypothetical protein
MEDGRAGGRTGRLPSSASLMLILAACSGSLASSALAQPVPPAKPRELRNVPAPASVPEPKIEAPPEPSQEQELAGAQECLARLKALGFDAEASGTPKAGNAACAIDAPVRLKSLKASDADRSIEFPAQPVVSCRFAEPLGRWLTGVVDPIVRARLGVALTAVRTGPGFECRNRNHAAAGKLSAHGLGLAMDISDFALAGNETLAVTPAEDARRNEVMATIRTAACGWFTTILGPGSDPAHATHLHLDIQQHGSSDRYRICQ